MWRIFRRWGKVEHVFIAYKLNNRGKIFGFVKFQGINNSKELERSLDNIWIANTKIYVNKPRCRRYEKILVNPKSHIGENYLGRGFEGYKLTSPPSLLISQFVISSPTLVKAGCFSCTRRLG